LPDATVIKVEVSQTGREDVADAAHLRERGYRLIALAVFLLYSIASPAYTVRISSYIAKVMNKEIIKIESKKTI
jgi:hypothetical protein